MNPIWSFFGQAGYQFAVRGGSDVRRDGLKGDVGVRATFSSVQQEPVRPREPLILRIRATSVGDAKLFSTHYDFPPEIGVLVVPRSAKEGILFS
jgi:hypothetical protein